MKMSKELEEIKKITYDISDYPRTKKYLREYYRQHINHPQVLREDVMKKVSISTKVNRDFYRSLRQNGETHYQIMKMIQPERLKQFTEDVYPILNIEEDREIAKPSMFKKIYNFFF